MIIVHFCSVMIHGANMTGSTSLFLWIGVGHIKPLTVATIYPDYFIKDTVADGDPITVMIIDTRESIVLTVLLL